ncbi:MAG: hypothetical protein AAGJ32_06065 [Pseudomonadota bacterium]
MTERTGDRVMRGGNQFVIGPSQLDWRDGELTITIDERGAPRPRPVRGRVTVQTGPLGQQAFSLDDTGRHTWQPLSPAAQVLVDFDQPKLRWSGRGYFDSNWGSEPLEEGFRFWDWARFELGDHEAAILYRTQPRSGAGKTLGLRYGPEGGIEPFRPVDAGTLRPTRYWRIRRPVQSGGQSGDQSEDQSRVHLIRTFEDTPFYSRSQIEATLFGARRRGVHETFDGDRLRRNIVRALLPVRMPRRR